MGHQSVTRQNIKDLSAIKLYWRKPIIVSYDLEHFKDAIKTMVQQAFTLASRMNSITGEANEGRITDLIPNGKPPLSAQSSLQYTDDSQSINSFFPDQQTLSKQRVRNKNESFLKIQANSISRS